MTGGVDEVDLVFEAIFGCVVHAHSRCLDGNAFFALQVHRIEQLFLHFAAGDRAGCLKQTVGQGRFAMIYVRNNAKVSYTFKRMCH